MRSASLKNFMPKIFKHQRAIVEVLIVAVGFVLGNYVHCENVLVLVGIL